jgi:hypothetical protein
VGPDDISGAIDALVATGMDRWDAVVSMIAAGMDPAAFPALAAVPRNFLRHEAMRNLEKAMIVLQGIAQVDPKGANAAMNFILEGRTICYDYLQNLSGGMKWITSLPRDLTVTGPMFMEKLSVKDLPENLTADLFLRDSPVRTLGKGLHISGSLDLGNTKITTLPEGLWVDGFLDLTKARKWDGQIPAGARIRTLYTPRHPNGDGRDRQSIKLKEWRALYPHGEPRG